ncbi:hypothetical protein [Micromonospora viridifaciens]|nr:hypothetical protein [Micromonospora viridifaciens]
MRQVIEHLWKMAAVGSYACRTVAADAGPRADPIRVCDDRIVDAGAIGH